jgi:predicted P-loop ATPase
MISAVARVYHPGCKADCCLILEGPQGRGKSSALKELGGAWFTDDLPDLSTKDAPIQLLGTWILEVSELDAFSRADVSRVKAFMSRATDRFRPPFATRAEDHPRQCVFAGTTNSENGYLRDPTGGRRFWPVMVGDISLRTLAEARAQLWAEAVARYQRGEPWWLDTPEMEEEAAKQVAQRYEGDPWERLVQQYVSGKPDVAVNEVLQVALDMPPDRWGGREEKRVARILIAMGWKRFQKRFGPKPNDREWRYRPVTSSHHDTNER